jgi:exodeoxyribonuclease X
MTQKLIRVVDFETNGMEEDSRVVECGICDLVDRGEGWEVGRPVSSLHRVGSIPPEVRAVHHITLEELRGAKPFEPDEFWGEAEAAGAVVVASHNTEFDGRFLGVRRRPLLCTLKSAYRVWPDAPAFNNGALRYWLQDQGLITLDHDLAMPPHRAGPDAYVTAHILRALLGEATAQQMVAWTKEPRLLPTCPIGKEWRGKKWADVDGGFLSWMLRQEDMEADFHWNAKRELDRRRSLAA